MGKVPFAKEKENDARFPHGIYVKKCLLPNQKLGKRQYTVQNKTSHDQKKLLGEITTTITEKCINYHSIWNIKITDKQS